MAQMFTAEELARRYSYSSARDIPPPAATPRAVVAPVVPTDEFTPRSILRRAGDTSSPESLTGAAAGLNTSGTSAEQVRRVRFAEKLGRYSPRNREHGEQGEAPQAGGGQALPGVHRARAAAAAESVEAGPAHANGATAHAEGSQGSPTEPDDDPPSYSKLFGDAVVRRLRDDAGSLSKPSKRKKDFRLPAPTVAPPHSAASSSASTASKQVSPPTAGSSSSSKRLVFHITVSPSHHHQPQPQGSSHRAGGGGAVSAPVIGGGAAAGAHRPPTIAGSSRAMQQLRAAQQSLAQLQGAGPASSSSSSSASSSSSTSSASPVAQLTSPPQPRASSKAGAAGAAGRPAKGEAPFPSLLSPSPSPSPSSAPSPPCNTAALLRQAREGVQLVRGQAAAEASPPGYSSGGSAGVPSLCAPASPVLSLPTTSSADDGCHTEQAQRGEAAEGSVDAVSGPAQPALPGGVPDGDGSGPTDNQVSAGSDDGPKRAGPVMAGPLEPGCDDEPLEAGSDDEPVIAGPVRARRAVGLSHASTGSPSSSSSSSEEEHWDEDDDDDGKDEAEQAERAEQEEPPSPATPSHVRSLSAAAALPASTSSSSAEEAPSTPDWLLDPLEAIRRRRERAAAAAVAAATAAAASTSAAPDSSPASPASSSTSSSSSSDSSDVHRTDEEGGEEDARADGATATGCGLHAHVLPDGHVASGSGAAVPQWGEVLSDSQAASSTTADVRVPVMASPVSSTHQQQQQAVLLAREEEEAEEEEEGSERKAHSTPSSSLVAGTAGESSKGGKTGKTTESLSAPLVDVTPARTTSADSSSAPTPAPAPAPPVPVPAGPAKKKKSAPPAAPGTAASSTAGTASTVAAAAPQVVEQSTSATQPPVRDVLVEVWVKGHEGRGSKELLDFLRPMLDQATSLTNAYARLRPMLPPMAAPAAHVQPTGTRPLPALLLQYSLRPSAGKISVSSVQSKLRAWNAEWGAKAVHFTLLAPSADHPSAVGDRIAELEGSGWRRWHGQRAWTGENVPHRSETPSFIIEWLLQEECAVPAETSAVLPLLSAGSGSGAGGSAGPSSAQHTLASSLQQQSPSAAAPASPAAATVSTARHAPVGGLAGLTTAAAVGDSRALQPGQGALMHAATTVTTPATASRPSVLLSIHSPDSAPATSTAAAVVVAGKGGEGGEAVQAQKKLLYDSPDEEQEELPGVGTKGKGARAASAGKPANQAGSQPKRKRAQTQQHSGPQVGEAADRRRGTAAGPSKKARTAASGHTPQPAAAAGKKRSRPMPGWGGEDGQELDREEGGEEDVGGAAVLLTGQGKEKGNGGLETGRGGSGKRVHTAATPSTPATAPPYALPAYSLPGASSLPVGLYREQPPSAASTSGGLQTLIGSAKKAKVESTDYRLGGGLAPASPAPALSLGLGLGLGAGGDNSVGAASTRSPGSSSGSAGLTGLGAMAVSGAFSSRSGRAVKPPTNHLNAILGAAPSKESNRVLTSHQCSSPPPARVQSA